MGKDLKGKELGQGLSQRKDGKYTARFTARDGKRKQYYHNKLNEVRRWLNIAVYDDEHSVSEKKEEMTIAKWSDIWLNEYVKDTVSRTTLKSYTVTCRQIIDLIGDCVLSELKQRTLQNFYNNIVNSGYRKGTIKLIIVLLNGMLKQARNNDYIADNVLVGLRPPSNIKDKAKRVLSVKEQELFVSYAKTSYCYPLIQTCLMTGMRIGEILALEWSDIDFAGKSIYVNKSMSYNNYDGEGCKHFVKEPKTKKGFRTIPLKNELVEMLSAHRISREECKNRFEWDNEDEFSDLVFTTKFGNPLLQSSIYTSLDSLVKRINKMEKKNAQEKQLEFVELRSISPHSLRHTFCTRCFEAGLNFKTIQYLMGHSSIKVTLDLYTHLTDEYKVDEFEKMSAIV